MADFSQDSIVQLVKKISDPALLVECETYRIVDVNQAALEIYGYVHTQDLTKRSFFDLVAEPSLREKACRESVVLMENISFLKQNGALFKANIHGFRVAVDHLPHSLYIVLIKPIITTEEEAYHIVLWQSVLQNIPLIVWIKDMEGRFSEVNENFLKLHGFRREEVIGKKETDLFPLAYAEASMQEDNCVVYSRAKIHKEESFVRNDMTLWYETFKLPLINSKDQVVGVAGVSVCINDRKEFEKQLKANEERLMTTLRSIGEAVITLDTKGYVTSLNPVAEVYLGLSQQKVLGRPLREVVFIRSPEDNEIEDPFALVQSQGPTSLTKKDRVLINGQGIEIPVEYKFSPIVDDSGYLTENGYVLIITNVSHYKSREQTLLAENQLMKDFIDSSPNAIFFTDAEGRMKRFNEEFSRLMGGNSASLVGKYFWEIFRGEDQAHLQKEFQGLKESIKIKNHIFTLIDMKKEAHFVEVSAAHLKQLKDDVYLFVLNDITDRMNHMRLFYKQQTSLEMMREILQAVVENHRDLVDVCRKVSAFMDVQRIFAYRWVPQDGVLDSQYVWSSEGASVASPKLEAKHFSEDWVGHVFQQGYLVLSADTPLNAYEKKHFEMTGGGSILFVPLWWHGELWGVLGVHDFHNERREWDETQLLFFQTIAPLFLSLISFAGK